MKSIPQVTEAKERQWAAIGEGDWPRWKVCRQKRITRFTFWPEVSRLWGAERTKTGLTHDSVVGDVRHETRDDEMKAIRDFL